MSHDAGGPHESAHSARASALWRSYLLGDQSGLDRRVLAVRRLMKHLPSDPRCKVCNSPFAGIGRPLVRVLGFGAAGLSSMNPTLCDRCERLVREHEVGAEVQMTLLFADVRGSTSLAEEVGPSEFQRIINRFYRLATDVLVDSDALIEKLIGDEVVGVFVPGIAGANHAERAVHAAQAILRATGHGTPEGPWLNVGAGVHTGVAYAGSVGSKQAMSTITVLGDPVNTAARLASAAGPGELLVSEQTVELSGLELGDYESRTLELKGRRELARVRVMKH